MSQTGRTAQTPPSCALGKVLAEDRSWHAGPQRACGLLRPQQNLTCQPWPPGQLSLKWEAGKTQKDPFLIRLIKKKKKRGRRNKIPTGIERGQEGEGGWHHKILTSHPPGVELDSAPLLLSGKGWSEHNRDIAKAQLENEFPLSWHGWCLKGNPQPFLQHCLPAFSLVIMGARDPKPGILPAK